jgi:undecaprenyl-diphosphatase
MTWWEALVLGVVQGLTEFFPVSSSGHLVMGQDILGLQIPGILFDIVVHVATLVSVCIVYRAKLAQLVMGALGRTEESSWPYILKIVVATIPAVVVGFTLKDWFEARFDDAVFAATMVLVTGCVVWSSRWATGVARLSPLELAPVAVAAAISAAAGTWLPFLAVLALQTLLMSLSRFTAQREVHREPTWIDALLMGIGQALAIFPGITRSGTTVLTGLWRRIDPIAAAEFSFLMSIPAILGAAVLQVPDVLRAEQMAVSPVALAAGFLGAALSGIVAIRFFVVLLKRQNFHVFAYYTWVAAAAFLFFARTGG